MDILVILMTTMWTIILTLAVLVLFMAIVSEVRLWIKDPEFASKCAQERQSYEVRNFK